MDTIPVYLWGPSLFGAQFQFSTGGVGCTILVHLSPASFGDATLCGGAVSRLVMSLGEAKGFQADKGGAR